MSGCEKPVHLQRKYKYFKFRIQKKTNLTEPDSEYRMSYKISNIRNNDKLPMRLQDLTALFIDNVLILWNERQDSPIMALQFPY